MNLDIQVVSMEDIGWDRGEIEENGSTIEDNSLIKAQAIWCEPHFGDIKLKHIQKSRASEVSSSRPLIFVL